MTNKEIYLIGYPIEKLSTRKLPTVQTVLKLFFFYYFNFNLTIRQCFSAVVDDVIKVWNLTGIPVCQAYNECYHYNYENISRMGALEEK